MAPARAKTPMVVANDVDAGDPGGLLIGAQGEHILAEGGLVPDEPHDGREDDGVEHIVWESGWRRRCSEGQVAPDEVRYSAWIQAGDGHAVVVARLDIEQQAGVEDQLGAQGDDEGMELELGHEEAVEGSRCRRRWPWR